MSSSKDSISTAVLAILGFVVFLFAVIFFAPLLGVLFGAFSGWVVSLFVGEWIVSGFAKFGLTITVNDLVVIGATLGFVGGFFKTVTWHKSNKE